jgi:hypothetical protein
VSALSALLRRGLPGLWAGALICLALIATPAPFAVLSAADAGQVVGRMFAREAPMSLAIGMLLLMLEHAAASARADAGRGSRMSAAMLLALGAMFCTVVGYYALQPMMAAARSGQGSGSFGQLHAASLGLFGLKIVLVSSLAWRAAAHRAS